MADPVGEEAWLSFVHEAGKSAGDLEQRVEVVELYKKATTAEPWSLKLWLAYCEWFWSLHIDCQTVEAGWLEEEREVGLEVFSLDTAQDVWEDAAKATQYRINDSHEIWDRWISIELEELAKSKLASGANNAPPAEVERVRNLFLDRLQTPHATWDGTSQQFSSFLSEYDEGSYESTMVEVTQLAKRAKELYSSREMHELKLKQAIEANDIAAQKAVMSDYLEWETIQFRIKPKKGQEPSPPILCIALFERAVLLDAIGQESSVWLDYIVFLHQNLIVERQDILLVLQRATSHCPTSSTLWARWIILAEEEQLDYENVESIMDVATNSSIEQGGIGSVVELYTAWCGYLVRRASSPDAFQDDGEIALKGMRSALKSVKEWGQKLHGKSYMGDPQFSIERIMIQYLTHRGSVDEARGHWKKLEKTLGDSYEFWQQYYLWEMTVREPHSPPSLATGVLLASIRPKKLDWPEKMMEIYLRHCHVYESADALLSAQDTVHIYSQIVYKRREKENAAVATLYAQQKPADVETAVETPPLSETKRKREPDADGVEIHSSKKLKSVEQVPDKDALREQSLKRDRENTSVLVTSLPSNVTQTKVRQYFKEYGHVNSITLKSEADESSSTALIEFRSNEDVKSALLRDGKYIGADQIHVVAAAGFTLYVTNFPPTADDKYLAKVFQDCGDIFSIRWPSLKFNAHRRFCYITFRSQEAAAQAVTHHGELLEGGYKLSAMYSDPGAKKARDGATAEGRELHVTSLDGSLKEDEIKAVFSKYGPVETVRLLRTHSGESKGAGFVVFENKDDATSALALHQTKLKSKVITVEPSTVKNFKQTATSKGTSASPTPEDSTNGNGHNKTSGGNCTITLLNIPDTVNDSRVRAIAEPFGSIVKVVLHPKHQGAIVEFEDSKSASRAALGLENHEIAPGRKLRTGNMKDLFGAKEEIKTDRIDVGGKKAPAFMPPSAPVRRPGAGGRGGLGTKRGLGFSAKSASSSAGAGPDEAKSTKSNADFKAMFMKGKE